MIWEKIKGELEKLIRVIICFRKKIEQYNRGLLAKLPPISLLVVEFHVLIL